MRLFKLFLFFPMFLLMACSAAYEKVAEIDTSDPKTFHDHLINNYKINASFEADEMHDWNAAKLYSEKALKALEGEKIYPELISYWKIPSDKAKDLKSGYNNLLSIYDEVIQKDPKNLAKAISSLDCWAEQEEEKWQTWDINKCKNDFHTAMHNIYKVISKENNKKEVKEKEIKKDIDVVVVTQNNKEEVLQIIYFDFDKYKLSQVSKNTLINFLNKNKTNLSKYIIYGHTDTKGTFNYNLDLSIKRAEVIRNILLNQGISKKDISILGKGENELAVNTPDDTKHPANRRAEVKILN